MYHSHKISVQVASCLENLENHSKGQKRVWDEMCVG